MAEVWLRPGHVLSGKYRIERPLGAGGMSVVVAATHLQLNQLVALKFLRKEHLGGARHVERFVREARAAARLRGPHIARILDAGTLRAGDALAPFIALEHLEGLDLARFLDRRQTLPPALAADIVAQTCAGVGEAHALGIVHRDLKPANVFLSVAPDGGVVARVLDFGVAKWRDPQQLTLTVDTILGSPAYMAPEQMRGAQLADSRSDVWSLGVVLFETLTGTLPFAGEHLPDLFLKVFLDEMPPLPSACGAPPGLEAVLRRCFSRDPEHRFADALELREALLPFVARVPVDPAELLAVDGEATIDDSVSVGTRTRAELGRPRRRRGLLAAALLVAAAAAVPLGITEAPVTQAKAETETAARAETRLEAEAGVVQAPAMVPVAAPVVAAPPARATPPRAPRRRPRAAPAAPAAAPDDPPAPASEPAWDPLAKPY